MYGDLSFDKMVSRVKIIFGWAIEDMKAECERDLKSSYNHNREDFIKKLHILENLEFDGYGCVLYRGRLLFAIGRYDGIKEVENNLEILFPFLYEVE